MAILESSSMFAARIEARSSEADLNAEQRERLDAASGPEVVDVRGGIELRSIASSEAQPESVRVPISKVRSRPRLLNLFLFR